MQVSRSIGDAYLKRAEFNREPLLPKFRFPGTFQKPILLAEPSIFVQKLLPEDQFLIFASDGLWEHLSNQEAVDIVSSCEHHVRLSSFFFFIRKNILGYQFFYFFLSSYHSHLLTRARERENTSFSSYVHIFDGKSPLKRNNLCVACD